jgi:hypothetical protein
VRDCILFCGSGRERTTEQAEFHEYDGRRRASSAPERSARPRTLKFQTFEQGLSFHGDRHRFSKLEGFGLGMIAKEATWVRRVSGYKAEDTTLGVSSRPHLIATSYPQSISEGELRGLFRSTLKTIYR